MPDAQTLWNIVSGFVLAVFGGVLTLVRDNQRDSLAERRKLDERLSKLEIMVAGQYVTRTDFNSLYDLLHQINVKLRVRPATTRKRGRA